MKLIFEGDHIALRSLISPLGRRMEFMETDGSVLIVYIEDNSSSFIQQIATLPNVTILPDHTRVLSDKHITKLSQFGVKKGHTAADALDLIFQKYPHAIADTSLPIH